MSTHLTKLIFYLTLSPHLGQRILVRIGPFTH